jgi:hypothetical protein
MLTTTTAVAACGGSSPSNSKLANQTQRSSAALKLAKCMRTHGVPDFPDPQSGGGFGIQATAGSGGGSISVDGHQISASQPAFRHAMDECQKYQPQGPPISGSQLAQIKQGALKMAECMRHHGDPNFPDPKVSAGPGGHGIQVQMGLGDVGGSKAGPVKASPAVQKGMSSCQRFMRVGPKAQKVGG